MKFPSKFHHFFYNFIILTTT